MLKYIILIVLLIIGICYVGVNRKWSYLDSFIGVMVIPMFIVVSGMIILTISLTEHIVSLNSIDEQMSIIEEQNEKIDTEIKNSVLFYMDYESDTYDTLKQDLDNVDLVVLTQQFPELKSNELVNTNINIYVENENKLTKLRLSKAKKQAFVDFWW